MALPAAAARGHLPATCARKNLMRPRAGLGPAESTFACGL